MKASQGRRRAFGQHFLRSEKVIHDTCEAARQALLQYRADRLLEIGPGKGALTEPLLRIFDSEEMGSVKDFLIIEKDRKIAENWIEVSRARERVTVVSQDFLEVPVATWAGGRERVVIVSNLPYSAGTAILKILVENDIHIPAMVLMFQEEVAKRIRAEPSTPDRGSLSLWIQNIYQPKKLLRVPPSAFNPPPKVFSEVISLVKRPIPLIPEAHQDPRSRALWNELLRRSFAHRRKMLRSGLGSWKKVLQESGVDETKRPEALEWEEWRKLFESARIHAPVEA